MQLIKDLGTRLINNKWIRLGIFLCFYCDKEVERGISNGLKQKSCGCVDFKGSNNGMYGKKHTEKAKIKQSISAKGKKRKPFTNEHRQAMSEAQKGKTKSEETRKKIKDGNKNRIPWNKGKKDIHSKEKNPNWQNGISFEPYGIGFDDNVKQQVLERDNYTCQNPNCLRKSNKLDCHHIDYNKQNNIKENLITLCCSCHMKTSGKNKRNYFIEFYKNINMEKYK